MQNYHSLSIFSKIEGIFQSPFLIKSAGETRSPAPDTPFGWFELSYKSPELLQELLKISQDNKYSEKVRNEALKSVNRITHRKHE